jgi:hypothetical protein
MKGCKLLGKGEEVVTLVVILLCYVLLSGA